MKLRVFAAFSVLPRRRQLPGRRLSSLLTSGEANAYFETRSVLLDDAGRDLRRWIIENDTTDEAMLRAFANIYEKAPVRPLFALEATLRARTFIADVTMKDFLRGDANEEAARSAREIVYGLLFDDEDDHREETTTKSPAALENLLKAYPRILTYDGRRFDWGEPRYRRAAQRIFAESRDEFFNEYPDRTTEIDFDDRFRQRVNEDEDFGYDDEEDD